MYGRIFFGSMASVAVVIAALWIWGEAPQLADNSARPDIASAALRCASVAMLAAAQVMLITFVLGAFFRRRTIDRVMGFSAALVCTVALVSAIALVVAGSGRI